MKRDKPDDWARLKHIQDAIDKIADFIKGYEEEQFAEDEKSLLAVYKLIEIIGEATYHLSKTLKEKYADVEWSKIERMRHRLVHEYYSIDSKIVWLVASIYVPQLGQNIKLILDQEFD